MAEEAKLTSLVVNAGSSLARTQIFCNVRGEGAHGDFRGLTLIEDGQHSDVTLQLAHEVPNTTSVETYKTVGRGRSRGVFQGKIVVARDAQKTDAKMMSKGLMLSDETEIFSKPELEIFADDVVCGHGSTCGALDEESMFYLMSRGIPRSESQAILVRAFLEASFDDIADTELHEALSAVAEAWLQRGAEVSFDLERVRADFPILKEKIHGHRLVYLDNGASAQKPQAVIDTIADTYAHGYANVHRGLHTLSQRATDAYELARERVRGFLNARRVEEIVFTKGATDALNLVASSFAAPRIGEGDEIVLTIMEHHSNIVPWQFLRERQGAVLKWVDVTDEGGFDLDAFEAALSDRTRIVAVTHMSNVLGTVTRSPRSYGWPMPAAFRSSSTAARARSHTAVDVQALDVDFYVITGHKLYGPSGIGALYGKYDLLKDMRPYQGGGEMIEEVSSKVSPTTRRHTVSRPARRRLCRQSDSAPHSTISKRSGAMPFLPMSTRLPPMPPSGWARSIPCD